MKKAFKKNRSNNQYDKDASNLTRKQKAYADYKLSHPKESNTKAALETYNTQDRTTASAIAAGNEKNQAVKSYLLKHSKRIEDLITDKTYELTSKDDLNSVVEGLKNARWMHDKIHGKATQKTELTVKTVELALDLTSDQIIDGELS
jgi:hypothetical protein